MFRPEFFLSTMLYSLYSFHGSLLPRKTTKVTVEMYYVNIVTFYKVCSWHEYCENVSVTYCTWQCINITRHNLDEDIYIRQAHEEIVYP